MVEEMTTVRYEVTGKDANGIVIDAILNVLKVGTIAEIQKDEEGKFTVTIREAD